MESQSFWRRMSEWFRAAGRPHEYESGSDVMTADREDAADDHALVPPAPPEPTAADRALERLETEYHRVVGLIESISTHLERQEDRATAMMEAIDSLCESLSSLPADSRAELDTLIGIREQLTEDAARAKRIEDQFTQLPKLADRQRETMASIDRRLSEDVARNERICASLTEVGEAVSAARESATESTSALRDVQARALEREERMQGMLEAQSKRLTWIAVVAIGVAATAVVVSAFALFR